LKNNKIKNLSRQDAKQQRKAKADAKVYLLFYLYLRTLRLGGKD
jgi:hypothetical protein